MTSWGCRWAAATPSALIPPQHPLRPDPPPHTHRACAPRSRPLAPPAVNKRLPPPSPLRMRHTRGGGTIPPPPPPSPPRRACAVLWRRRCVCGEGGPRMRRRCRRGLVRERRAGGGGAGQGRAVRDGRGRADHAEDPHHRRERRRQVQVRGCQRFPAGHKARGRRAGRPASGRGLPSARPGPASFRPGPAGGGLRRWEPWQGDPGLPHSLGCEMGVFQRLGVACGTLLVAVVQAGLFLS